MIISEVGVNSIFSSGYNKYQGKLYDLSVFNGDEMLKTWNNVEIMLFNSDKIEFTQDGNEVSILPSVNSTIILNEVIDPLDPLNLFD